MEETEVQDTRVVPSVPSNTVVQQQSGTPVQTEGAPASDVVGQGSCPHIVSIRPRRADDLIDLTEEQGIGTHPSMPTTQADTS